MKDYITSLLDKSLDESKSNVKIGYLDISFLKEVINHLSISKEYFYSFILDFSNDYLKEITDTLEPENERESFYASIIYLKKLIEINTEEAVDIPLSVNQEEILYQLIELIKKIVDNDEEISEEKNKYYQKLVKTYQTLLNKFKNNKVLSIDDYEVIEYLIKENEKGDLYKRLNEVVDFINDYNLDLLPEYTPKVEEKENEEEAEEVQEKMVLEEAHEEEISPLEEPIIEEEKVWEDDNSNEDITEDISEAQEVEEIVEDIKEENENLESNNESYSYDIFNPQQFTSSENIEDNKQGANILNKYYMIEEPLLKRYEKDLLKENDFDTLVEYLRNKDFSDRDINDLARRCLPAFLATNKNNFKENADIAQKYLAIIKNLVNKNITYFYNTPTYNQTKIKLLEEKGLVPKLIFRYKPELLSVPLDRLLRNLDALNKYGIEIKDDDYNNLSILANLNLNFIIDSFIEEGLDSYLKEDGVKNIRSLIIKNVFNSYKNHIKVWENKNFELRKNDNFEKWINKDFKILDASEIDKLKAKYQILDKIDNKYKTNDHELTIDGLIISRIKLYSIFRVLAKHKIDNMEGVMYALTYNSVISDEEYLLLERLLKDGE